MDTMTIASDYGHGTPPDTGAVGYLSEEHVINTIAPLVDQGLRLQGHTIINTRPYSATSVNNSLNQRTDKANRANVDLFISHHANKAGGYEVGFGHEVWILSTGGKAEQYARNVDKALTDMGSHSRGVKTQSYAVLRNTKAPAILIEYFFVATKRDVDFYSKTGASKYAEAVVKGITGTSVSLPSVTEATTPIETDKGGDYMSKAYKNGSTRENVYSDYNMSNKIGSLDTYESCEAIADLGNRMIVLYNTPSGKKTGFVAYRGGL